MYERHFGFAAKPFALTPDPSFLYLSPQHARALTMLEYGLESQAPFLLLTGDIGAGKTTLVRTLLNQLGDKVVVGSINQTHSRFKSTHPWALAALGVADHDQSEIGMFQALVNAITREYRNGRRTLLIFDEAQNLPIPVLEELRLLSNINTDRDLMLQIMLVGQPQLRGKIALPVLQQFAQRVAVYFHLKPLNRTETYAYIAHRLQAAGGNPNLFLPEAIEFVFARTKGVPRLINQVCDYALVYGFAERRSEINADLIGQVVRDFKSGMVFPTAGLVEPVFADNATRPGETQL